MPCLTQYARTIRRLITFAAVAVIAALLSMPAAPAVAKQSIGDFEVGNYPIGGDFALTNQDGGTTGLRDFRGKVVVMFFGYTYCPDVCPLTLSEMGKLTKDLGADAKRVQPIFVTIDPARDTAKRLKSYLGNFEPGIIGLTGSERDIAGVAKLYHARYAKRGDSAAGYLMDHTAFVYLVDPNGKVRYLVPYDVGADVLADGARKLLKG